MAAPIALFVYQRPELTFQTLDALSKNELADVSTLYIFSDGPKNNATINEIENISRTRTIIRQKNWCKKVIINEFPENKGLAKSVIDGVSQLLEEYDSVIVLEDDLITSIGFLKYMNDGLNMYRKNKEVMQISGYQFPIQLVPRNTSFFLPMTSSWGWATWRRAWVYFDPNATGYENLFKNRKLRYKFNLGNSYAYSDLLKAQMIYKTVDSWAIRWWWSVFKSGGLTLYPDTSLVKNIGIGNTATHTSNAGDVFTTCNFNNNYFIYNFPILLNTNKIVFKQVKIFLSKNTVSKKSTNYLQKFVLKVKNCIPSKNIIK